jgi:type IV secretory pathway TrbD component
MAEQLATTVEIPTGLTHPRLMAGLPLPATLGLLCLVICSMAAFGVLYGGLSLIPITPIWGFLRHHTRTDPGWCEAWMRHVQLATYYHP